VIALSTSLQVSPREGCHGIGITDRVPKPVRFEALQSVLNRRLLCLAEGERADN